MKLHSLLEFVAIPIPQALHPLSKRGPHLLVAPLICHITPVGPTSVTIPRGRGGVSGGDDDDDCGGGFLLVVVEMLLFPVFRGVMLLVFGCGFRR